MSLLRKLVEHALDAFEGPDEQRRLQAALFVGAYRFLSIGGTVSLSDELTLAEVVALEEAQKQIETEQLERLADALQAPHGLGVAVARKRVDGGKALDKALTQLALTQRPQGGAS